MGGPKFCAMKIARDVRDYAKGLNEQKGFEADGAQNPSSMTREAGMAAGLRQSAYSEASYSLKTREEIHVACERA